MKILERLIFLIAAVFLLLLTACASSAAPLNSNGVRVFYNAAVYTADATMPNASAFVIDNGQFVYVGNDEGALQYGQGFNLRSRRVIPGMIDSHNHLNFFASVSSLPLIPLDPKQSQEKVLTVLKKAHSLPLFKKADAIFGFGFGPQCTRETATAQALDQVIPDKPVFLASADGHSAWLNTKALAAAGITASTPDPVPGSSYYERYADGNPTGYIVEILAVSEAFKQIQLCTEEDLARSLPAVQTLFNRHGVTGILDAGVFALSDESMLNTLRRLEGENALTLRHYTSSVYRGSVLQPIDQQIAAMKKLRTTYSSSLIKPNTLKLFYDGTVEVFTAGMFEPYLPPGSGTGLNMFKYDEMLAVAKAAAAEGFDIHIHAIGDKAVSESLRLFKELGPISGTKTIAHAQIITAEEINRFSTQGDVFYQTTPAWLGANEFSLAVLGESRYNSQMPLGRLLRANVPLTFGSDLPASGMEGLSPIYNIHFAVNRAFDDGTHFLPPPSEGITVAECIDAYTINGARQLGASDTIGSITVGKSADFVILNADIFTVKPQKIETVTVKETWFRGNRIYPAR